MKRGAKWAGIFLAVCFVARIPLVAFDVIPDNSKAQAQAVVSFAAFIVLAFWTADLSTRRR